MQLREHLQTEFSMHNVIVMSEVVEAMTLRTIAGISCLNLLQNLAKLVPSVTLRGEGRGMSELNITMVLNSVWRCSLI